ncbi:MAG: hypothetical protein U9N10_11450 [Bacillota bacterium]|nr:hypothetical protein [Bacillota bacterium]
MKEKYVPTIKDKFNFFVMSAIGMFMFFIPITIGGKKTIPLDHVVSFVKGEIY